MGHSPQAINKLYRKWGLGWINYLIFYCTVQCTTWSAPLISTYPLVHNIISDTVPYFTSVCHNQHLSLSFRFCSVHNQQISPVLPYYVLNHIISILVWQFLLVHNVNSNYIHAFPIVHNIIVTLVWLFHTGDNIISNLAYSLLLTTNVISMLVHVNQQISPPSSTACTLVWQFLVVHLKIRNFVPPPQMFTT